MKKMRLFWIAVVLIVCGMAVISCNGKKVEKKSVKGVLDVPVGQLRSPDCVEATMGRHVLDDNFEIILQDTVSNVGVWSLIRCAEEESSDDFGLVVVHKGYATAFPGIRHGNNPSASYDSVSGNLWITGGVIEGTGVLAERPYLMRFRENGSAFIVASIDPYDMQQELCKELMYSVSGEDVTLYNGDQELAKVTNTIKDMGGFDEDCKIENSEYTAADPTTALMLTTRLQNANAKCVYRSGLIGLGQPAWYFEAWKHTEEDDPEE